MKIKVLFVIDSLHSGGAEKSLISLLSLIDYKKYEVDLLAFVSDGLYSSLIHPCVNQLQTPRVFDYMKLTYKQLISQQNYEYVIWRALTSICIRVNRYLKNIPHGSQQMWDSLSKKINSIDKQYDCAIAYSQGNPTYFVADKVRAKKKYCWINTDYNAAGYSTSFDYNYYAEYKNIIAVSESCKSVIMEVYPKYSEKVKVIYDIISSDLIRSMAAENIEFDDDFKGYKILTIGRLVSSKGYDIAIKTADFLRNKKLNFKWYIIGEGPLKDELINLIEEKKLNDYFVFLGTTINPYPYILKSDVYCQPSRFEGFGMAIAEAKILGKPVVATNFNTIHNQIKHEHNGLICEFDGEIIGENIIKLLSDQELKQNIITNLKNEKLGTVSELEKFYQLIENF